jgi:hypothetical protein
MQFVQGENITFKTGQMWRNVDLDRDSYFQEKRNTHVDPDG